MDYKQLLNQIEDYMFDIPIPGHNWGTGAIEGEETTRCAVRVYESSIGRYETIKDVGQWVKKSRTRRLNRGTGSQQDKTAI